MTGRAVDDKINQQFGLNADNDDAQKVVDAMEEDPKKSIKEKRAFRQRKQR